MIWDRMRSGISPETAIVAPALWMTAAGALRGVMFSSLRYGISAKTVSDPFGMAGVISPWDSSSSQALALTFRCQ